MREGEQTIREGDKSSGRERKERKEKKKKKREGRGRDACNCNLDLMMGYEELMVG